MSLSIGRSRQSSSVGSCDDSEQIQSNISQPNVHTQAAFIGAEGNALLRSTAVEQRSTDDHDEHRVATAACTHNDGIVGSLGLSRGCDGALGNRWFDVDRIPQVYTRRNASGQVLQLPPFWVLLSLRA